MQTMSLVRNNGYSPRNAVTGNNGLAKGKRMSKIYLVDDDENILTSVSMFLEGEGYEVRKFHDGVSALEALKASPPDLAVFDVKMPRMDGLELLRRLRQTSMPSMAETFTRASSSSLMRNRPSPSARRPMISPRTLWPRYRPSTVWPSWTGGPGGPLHVGLGVSQGDVFTK